MAMEILRTEVPVLVVNVSAKVMAAESTSVPPRSEALLRGRIRRRIEGDIGLVESMRACQHQDYKGFQPIQRDTPLWR